MVKRAKVEEPTSQTSTSRHPAKTPQNCTSWVYCLVLCGMSAWDQYQQQTGKLTSTSSQARPWTLESSSRLMTFPFVTERMESLANVQKQPKTGKSMLTIARMDLSIDFNSGILGNQFIWDGNALEELVISFITVWGVEVPRVSECLAQQWRHASYSTY